MQPDEARPLRPATQKIDENASLVRSAFTHIYGKGNETKWIVNWRLFFLACSELFGYADGEEWMVSHYLFQKPAAG